MTDFAAEQEEELEALAAIFQDEFVPDEHQPETKFSIVINDLDFLSSDIVIDFKYTDTYPDAPPEFAIQPTNQLLPDLKTRAMEAMAAAAAEDPGEVCVFNIVTAAKEWLTENFDADNEVETVEKKVEVELTQEERGTPVTKENFVEWHAAFVAGLKAQGKWFERQKRPGKTGRQLFECGMVQDQLDETGSSGPAPERGGKASAKAKSKAKAGRSQQEAAAAMAARAAKLEAEQAQAQQAAAEVFDEDLFDDDDLSSDSD